MGPLSYLLSLFLAWLVNEFKNPWKTILTVVFYAPTLSNAVFTIWMIVFDGDIYGYLNSFLINAGFINDPIQWRSDPQYMMTVVIIVQLWVRPRKFLPDAPCRNSIRIMTAYLLRRRRMTA